MTVSRAAPSANDFLLTDAQMLSFILRGYAVLRPAHPPGYDAAIHEALLRPGVVTGGGITDTIPTLFDVCDRPEVQGFLTSVLGPAYRRLRHRNLYVNAPGSRSQGWHQDDDDAGRQGQVSVIALFYYPQDVTLDMGPTVVLPGSHLRVTTLDDLGAYANIKGQQFMQVPAGAVVMLHGGLWHAGTLNRSPVPRFMMKFMFERTTSPERPSWNHDPTDVRALLRRHLPAFHPPVLSLCSDALEEWRRRLALWNWLRGSDPPVPCETTLDILDLLAP